MGAANAEDSIYKAMLYLIETSEHYIFIENQYFISSNSEAELIPRNKIALAILDRCVVVIIVDHFYSYYYNADHASFL